MVLTQDFLDTEKAAVKVDIAAEFTHIAFGTGTATPSSSDTALGAEVIRVARQSIDSTPASSVIVSGYIGGGSANGNTIAEVGACNAASGPKLRSHSKLLIPIAKTSDKEVWVDVVPSISVTQG